MQYVWHRDFDGWWYATLRDGGRRRQIKLLIAPNTARAKRLAEAELLPHLNARLDKPSPTGDAWMTVRHVIDGFLDHSRAKHEPETHEWYSALVAGFTEQYGDLAITDLRRKQVIAFVEAKYENPTSQNKAIGAIRRSRTISWRSRSPAAVRAKSPR